MKERFQFKVAYDLECEYVDRLTGRTYRVRHGCHHGNTREDYLPTIKALIGTVRNDGYGTDESAHEFPPEDVIEAFRQQNGMPIVGARFTSDWQVEYSNGRKPAVVEVWGGTTTQLLAWAGYCSQPWDDDVPSVMRHHLF